MSQLYRILRLYPIKLWKIDSRKFVKDTFDDTINYHLNEK